MTSRCGWRFNYEPDPDPRQPGFDSQYRQSDYPFFAIFFTINMPPTFESYYDLKLPSLLLLCVSNYIISILLHCIIRSSLVSFTFKQRQNIYTIKKLPLAYRFLYFWKQCR
ncbi:uncharacterized protein K460DRAFT_176846 [Cucurbitaria berberidis CBS 394.84]|uniref:Uncharacterized protein n=1 Tax=Cucurbitaria berberidis CBS 394.84 TaxID=1168544 RepID=A0A9P4GAJ2_9PLEO|nr:uncharacterized protein K460DRAFT_176846 [Cucurbitaria berberidis CBS 394.84]KAF1841979.1 hypothetical protein K460DRAFT_176846 [Cucurbitaria berberidis CBS 394.84]